MSAPYWIQNAINAFPAADFRNGQVLLSASNGAAFWPAGQTTVAELAVVVQAASWAQGHILTLNQSSTTDALQIRVTTSNIEWAYRATDNTLQSISAPLPTVGEPHELRLVKTATGDVFGFVDGVEVASASDARGPIFGSGGTVPITLGGRSNLTNGFDGAVSEVVIRNVVLTPQDRLRESNYLRTKYGVSIPVDAPAFTDGSMFSDGTLFTDTPSSTPLISVSPLFVAPGGEVQVQVASAPNSVENWVALYAADETQLEAYFDWQYLNGTQVEPPTPLRSATLTFSAPLTVGQYLFRLFRVLEPPVTLATSEIVTVQEVTGGVYAPGVYQAGVYV